MNTRRCILLILLVSLSACVSGGRKWRRVDTVMQASFGTTLAADYIQTRDIVRDGLEMNPIIGTRGERVAPEIYFPAVFAAHTTGIVALPPRWRGLAQFLSIGACIANAMRNWSIGYPVHF